MFSHSMAPMALRLASKRWTYTDRRNHFYVSSTGIWLHYKFIGSQVSKTITHGRSRSFTSRSGKIYRKGRRKPATNFDKKTTVAPVQNSSRTKTVEGTNNISTSISVMEAQGVRYGPFHGFKQWLERLKSNDEPIWKVALLALVPKRYRYPSGKCSQMYSYGQGILIAQRLALWTSLVFILVVYDQTSPFELVRIRGPSMLPTMAADGSDLWLCRIYPSWLRQSYDTITNPLLLSLIQPRLRRGSIVGFAHPDCPNNAISMKRIIGLPGDRVQRYGQYVHLYIDQDPIGWGITWPTTYDSNHIWIKNREANWDVGRNEKPTNLSMEAIRTLVVPDGHVWIEADCPALGLDSRQFGPIPISWIRTRVVAKNWPLQVSPMYKRWHHRPHPIPLDVETLMDFNVFYDTGSNKPST